MKLHLSKDKCMRLAKLDGDHEVGAGFETMPTGQQVKADPYSLDSLIAWLEEQPAGKQYNYRNSNGGCLLDLYLLDAVGQAGPVNNHIKVCGSIRRYVHIAAKHPMTIGGALERARDLAK